VRDVNKKEGRVDLLVFVIIDIAIIDGTLKKNEEKIPMSVLFLILTVLLFIFHFIVIIP
jgi:hypothetical protein